MVSIPLRGIAVFQPCYLARARVGGVAVSIPLRGIAVFQLCQMGYISRRTFRVSIPLRGIAVFQRVRTELILAPPMGFHSAARNCCVSTFGTNVYYGIYHELFPFRCAELLCFNIQVVKGLARAYLEVSIPLRGIAVFQQQERYRLRMDTGGFPFRCAELLCFNSNEDRRHPTQYLEFPFRCAELLCFNPL